MQEMQMIRSLVDKYPYVSMVGFFLRWAFASGELISRFVGYRIPGRRCSTNGQLSLESGLSLPMLALQRRPSQADPARYHIVLG